MEARESPISRTRSLPQFETWQARDGTFVPSGRNCWLGGGSGFGGGFDGGFDEGGLLEGGFDEGAGVKAEGLEDDAKYRVIANAPANAMICRKTLLGFFIRMITRLVTFGNVN